MQSLVTIARLPIATDPDILDNSREARTVEQMLGLGLVSPEGCPGAQTVASPQCWDWELEPKWCPDFLRFRVAERDCLRLQQGCSVPKKS
jgi:hypothetical protein